MAWMVLQHLDPKYKFVCHLFELIPLVSALFKNKLMKASEVGGWEAPSSTPKWTKLIKLLEPNLWPPLYNIVAFYGFVIDTDWNETLQRESNRDPLDFCVDIIFRQPCQWVEMVWVSSICPDEYMLTANILQFGNEALSHCSRKHDLKKGSLANGVTVSAHCDGLCFPSSRLCLLFMTYLW